MTPEDPGFYAILHATPPPGWRDNLSVDFCGAMAVKSDSLLIQPLTKKEAEEYLYGGEYDELAYLEDANSNN